MSRSRPFRFRSLRLERLEERSVPAIFGLAWPDASRLSLSFAADGTMVDGQSSGLFNALAALPADSWKTEMLRAFQTWAVHANINIGLVADGGENFGVTGAIQGDTRFGDIRIGAKSEETHLATSSPFSFLSATRAGDFFLNTGVNFGIGDPNCYDIYSVVLHEAGNILGLADNNVASSAMYQYYNGIRSDISTADIGELQSLYGARSADALEGGSGNDSFATATAVGTTAVVADITTLSDVDFYSFIVPNGTTTITVRVKAGGVSLLTPTLTIYDANYNIVATASSTNPLDNTVLLQLDNVAAGTQYFAKVGASRGDQFGIGAYRFRVFAGPASQMGTGVNNNDFRNGFVRDDLHTNDTLAEATNLDRTFFTTDSRFDHRLVAKLRDASDVDFYKLTSSEPVSGESHTMMVTVYGLTPGQLNPIVTVYDAAGSMVAAEVLVNGSGNYVVQVANAAANALYYLKVEAADPSANNIGDYFLGVDFQRQLIELTSAGAGTLDSTKLEDWRTLQNFEGQVFHFVLHSSANSVTDTAVRMTIYDINGNVVFTLLSTEGKSVSGNVYLAAGNYAVRFEGGTRNGTPMPELSFDLRCTNVTDPLDPMPVDPTEDPVGAPTFSWQMGLDPGFTFLQTADPYSNPWSGG